MQRLIQWKEFIVRNALWILLRCFLPTLFRDDGSKAIIQVTLLAKSPQQKYQCAELEKKPYRLYARNLYLGRNRMKQYWHPPFLSR